MFRQLSKRPIWLRCTVALILVIIAAIIREKFFFILGTHTTFVTVYLAVIIAAIYGGFYIGLTATALSGLIATFFWLEPIKELSIGNPGDLIALVVFLSSGVIVSALAALNHKYHAFLIEKEKMLFALQQKEKDLLKTHEQIKNFSYSAIHDTKNPAIGVYTMAMLLKKGYGNLICDDKGKRYLEIMEQSAKDIVSLMDQLGAFIKSRECPLIIEIVNLQTEIDTIHANLIPVLEKRNIQWIQKPGTLPSIRADRLSLVRIFRNILDNALKHGGDKLSQLRVEYLETDGFHSFQISDDGCGIDELGQENIFEAFARTSKARAVEGLGLGLAVVKDLVEKHGGAIHVNSAPGIGTTFTFTISKTPEQSIISRACREVSN